MSEPADRTAAANDRGTERYDLTTRLAADRTMLAAERTYAAWVRTGLASLAAGAGARLLLDGVAPLAISKTTGVTLCVFSAICFIAAVWRELVPGTGAIPLDARRLSPALLIGVNGWLAVVALIAAWGILRGR